ncbi:hypothetical protein ACTMTF_04315 [Nonomuraea sp. ZG12]|uniref:hypothetical protein n=1 Tax=Nonomuraea sp. ZG12 TaxID=3452207 RepID=UPI003F89A14A
MPDRALPDAVPPARAAERWASAWLAQHDLTDDRPTPLLTARLTARRRARLADHVLLAVLIIVAALAQVYGGLTPSAPGGSEARQPMPLLILIAAVAGLLLVQSLSDWWVRRVDRRAGAALSRRAAHPVQPGWRALLGLPHALFTAATLTGAAALAVSALTIRDSTVGYAALITLVGLAGVAAGLVLRLRDVLLRPIVAEDETSLMADVVMRVEDARDLNRTTVAWVLPMVLLFGSAPGWWKVAALGLMILWLVALFLVPARTPPIATVARQAMDVR